MSTTNRNVRLGIVYRGSIIQEEVVDRRIDVSIGIRPGSTVQVSPKLHPDFPDNFDLLAIENGQYYMVVPQDPSARISLRGAAAGSEQKTIRGKRCIPVEGVAGGSLVMGDVTVMFQFVRADTTPTVTRDRTVLRIGLVYEERLISDRIFPDAKAVTIGNDKNNTIVLPIEDYQGPPIAFVNNKDGSATLRSPLNLKVRVAIDGSPMELKDLQQKGKARQEGNDVLCHLPLGSRGRAVMGAHTVLFQVVKQTVTVPVMAPKSALQKVAGVFLIDPTWSISFLVAFLLTGAVVGQAILFQNTTGKYLGKQKSEEELAHNTYEVQVEQKEEEKPPEEEKKDTVDVVPDAVKNKQPEKADKKPDKKAEVAKVDKQDKPESTGKTVDPDEAKRNARAAVQTKTIAGAFGSNGAATKLFATGEGEDGTVVAKTFGGDGGDKDGTGGPGGSSLKLAANSGGGGTVEKVSGGKKGFGDRKADVAKVDGGVKKEETVKIKLSSGGVEGGDGESRGEVAKVIARKNSAVQQCYERALRDNPDEGGKVKVSFTVGTAGTVTDVNVSGASGGFADCIKNKFTAIRGLPLLASPQSFNQSYVFSKN
jgi:outer membrane biosynthesis protein TonB